MIYFIAQPLPVSRSETGRAPLTKPARRAPAAKEHAGVAGYGVVWDYDAPGHRFERGGPPLQRSEAVDLGQNLLALVGQSLRVDVGWSLSSRFSAHTTFA